jgi:2Fe-2S ferredoxin
MAMPNILATDREGSVREVPATAGLSVMEILRGANLDVAGSCGGNCICGTCHVYIAERWQHKLAAPDSDERELLEQFVQMRSNSRLSCQIAFDSNLDGIELTVAPQE